MFVARDRFFKKKISQLLKKQAHFEMTNLKPNIFILGFLHFRSEIYKIIFYAFSSQTLQIFTITLVAISIS